LERNKSTYLVKHRLQGTITQRADWINEDEQIIWLTENTTYKKNVIIFIGSGHVVENEDDSEKLDKRNAKKQEFCL